MEAAPNTRGHHALRWVLGVGLVFVVVVGMGLQAAKRRADKRWISMMLDWNEEWWRCDGMVAAMPPFDVFVLGDSLLPEAHSFYPNSHRGYLSYSTGGNILRSWRQSTGGRAPCTLVIRQERNLFGSSIEARLSGGTPEQVEGMTAIFAAVDVNLVVES